MEPKILLKDNTGKVIMELAKPDLSQVYAAGWKKPENFVVKAADNVTDLYGVMWKPSNLIRKEISDYFGCLSGTILRVRSY